MNWPRLILRLLSNFCHPRLLSEPRITRCQRATPLLSTPRSGPGFSTSRGSERGHRSQVEHHFKSRLFINGPISHTGTERTKRGGYLNERRALADNVSRFASGLQHDQRESVRHHPSRYIPYPFPLLHEYSSTASLSRRKPKRRCDGDTGC